MPVPQRDLEGTAKRLVEWFGRRMPQASELDVVDLVGPGSTGFSNDTLMFQLVWRQDGREHRDDLVVRIEPQGVRVFPEYDLGRQFRVMQALADTAVPVPRMFGQELDGDLLGGAFYVMQRIEGQVPSDTPSYHAEGWMTKLSPAERAAIWWDGLRAMAAIHALDWRALDFDFLEAPSSARAALDRQLDDYERYLDWASEGRPHPISQRGLAWLRRNRPAGREPVSLCWGDSRLGNMMFRDSRCVAVLDWEMVTLGNPEQDFAWWLFFDRHHSEGLELPRLAGLPSREETIARYESWLGRKIEHLEYYEVFAAFRFSVIMIRVATQLRVHGLLPEESELSSRNICTRLLAGMIGVEHPD